MVKAAIVGYHHFRVIVAAIKATVAHLENGI